MGRTLSAVLTAALLASSAASADGAVVVGCNETGKLILTLLTYMPAQSAKQRAMDACTYEAHNPCQTGIGFPDGAWVAVAASTATLVGSTCPVYGLGKGSRSEAESDAVASCQQRGGRCSIALSQGTQ